MTNLGARQRPRVKQFSNPCAQADRAAGIGRYRLQHASAVSLCLDCRCGTCLAACVLVLKCARACVHCLLLDISPPRERRFEHSAKWFCSCVQHVALKERSVLNPWYVYDQCASLVLLHLRMASAPRARCDMQRRVENATRRLSTHLQQNGNGNLAHLYALCKAIRLRDGEPSHRVYT